MRFKLRERVGSAHLIALLALFVALGSTAYAANKIGSSQIKKNAVTTAKIKKNAVTTAKIKRKAVTTAKIKKNAVTAARIKNGAVTTAKIPSNAVTTAKIPSNAVTTAKIPDQAVTSGKLADGAVTPGKMSEYTNSGLVKLNNGESKVLLTRGPFTFTANCSDDGGGSSTATMVAKNNGTEAGLFESDYENNYDDPVFDPGEELNAFTETSDSTPYWFGDYWNNFSAMSVDGSTSLYGGGNIGVKVVGADCAFQLFTQGA